MINVYNDAIHQLDQLNSFPAIALFSLLAQWLEHSVYNRGIASSSLTTGIVYFIFFWLDDSPYAVIAGTLVLIALNLLSTI